MKKVISLFFFAALLLVACKTSKNTTNNDTAKLDSSSNFPTVEKWIVANEKVKCSEESEKLCFQVKKGTSMDYEMVDAEIVGFTFEPGYKYQLEVKVLNNKKTGTEYSLIKELYKVPMK